MSAYTKKPSRTRVEELIRQSGLKKTWIAERLGVSQPMFSHWVTGRLVIPDDQLDLLLQLLRKHGVDATAAQVRAVNGHPRPLGRPRSPRVSESPPPPYLRSITTPAGELLDAGPLVDVSVYRYIAAGPLSDEALELEEEPVKLPAEYRGYLALRVAGRSMEPDIAAGALVLVRETTRASDGDTVIAEIESGSCVAVLRIDGRRRWLEKTNPEHGDIPIRPGEGVRIRGVVEHVVTVAKLPRHRRPSTRETKKKRRT